MITTQPIRRAIDPAAVAAALGGPATRPPGLVTQPVSLVPPPLPAPVPTAAVPAVEPEPAPAPPAPSAPEKPKK